MAHGRIATRNLKNRFYSTSVCAAAFLLLSRHFNWGIAMQLKRTLNRIETVALSVAVIAMTVGMALNTPFVAAASGAAVPLVYIISTVGVLCIALSFVRLASKIGHAGSVYGLIRYAQGRNPGFIAGWALLLTYTLFIASAATIDAGVYVPNNRNTPASK